MTQCSVSLHNDIRPFAIFQLSASWTIVLVFICKILHVYPLWHPFFWDKWRIPCNIMVKFCLLYPENKTCLTKQNTGNWSFFGQFNVFPKVTNQVLTIISRIMCILSWFFQYTHPDFCVIAYFRCPVLLGGKSICTFEKNNYHWVDFMAMAIDMKITVSVLVFITQWSTIDWIRAALQCSPVWSGQSRTMLVVST